jgi:CHAT domain-containing protein
MVNHEIVSLSSASVMGVIRKDMAGRPPPSKMVAVIADPVFEKDDSRVKAIGGGPRSTGDRPAPIRINRGLSRARRGGGQSFPRLLSARLEAEAVMSLVPEGAGIKALDFDASRATATSDEIRQYRIVHFATHGVIDAEHPELSAVVLSLVDDKGRPQDGFLRLQDIYNLRLSSDLVVLSACDLALGKDIKGEGLVGITRGFMYAGAVRVVASLWQVEDDATSAMMKKFYEEMLRRGERPSAALRQAQVYMWNHKQWEEPYYWAGFILQGEWR